MLRFIQELLKYAMTPRITTVTGLLTALIQTVLAIRPVRLRVTMVLANRVKIAITARTIVGKKPRGHRTADTVATATSCPIVAMRGVPRKGGFAVAALAKLMIIATTANGATVPRPALVGAARVVAIHAQAKAAMRLTMCAWPVVATRHRAMSTAIAAQTTARMALAEVISAAYLNCNT
jgi:hypothetical protein